MKNIPPLIEIVNQTVVKSFEEMMTQEFEAMKADYEKQWELKEAEFRKRWNAKIAEARKEIKRAANTMTLELLQKANISGISVEFKI